MTTRRSVLASILRSLLVLALASAPGLARAEEAKVKLLIITGSHSHDWKNTLPILKDFLSKTGRIEVDVTLDPGKELTPEKLARYDVFLLHYKETKEMPGRWPEAAEKALLQAVEGGKGLVALHYASAAFDDGKSNWPEYEKLIGGGWRRSKGHGAHAPGTYQFRVELKDREHPITKGFPASFLHTPDELYHKLMMVEGNHVLAEALDNHQKGTQKKEPLVWVRTYGKGRVYHNALGHGPDQQKLGIGFQALMARGVEWAATGKVTIPVPAQIDSPPVEKTAG